MVGGREKKAPSYSTRVRVALGLAAFLVSVLDVAFVKDRESFLHFFVLTVSCALIFQGVRGFIPWEGRFSDRKVYPGWFTVGVELFGVITGCAACSSALSVGVSTWIVFTIYVCPVAAMCLLTEEVMHSVYLFRRCKH